MSLHFSEVVLKGSHLAAIPGLFERMSYRIVAPPLAIELAATAEPAPPQPEAPTSFFAKLKAKAAPRPAPVRQNPVHTALEAGTGNINVVRKAVYEVGGWTHIGDPELVMSTDADALRVLSGELKTRVVAWVCEGTSGTYGLSVFDGGRSVRSVLVCGGEVEEEGARLPEEGEIEWNQAFEDDVMSVVGRLGAAYDQLESPGTYFIYELDGSAESA